MDAARYIGYITSTAGFYNNKKACYQTTQGNGDIKIIKRSCNTKQACMNANHSGGTIRIIMAGCNVTQVCYKAASYNIYIASIE